MDVQVFKIELLLVDHDGLGMDGVTTMLEDTSYPNHAIGPNVMRVESRVVEWSDSHPLNQLDKMNDAYAELFPS